MTKTISRSSAAAKKRPQGNAAKKSAKPAAKPSKSASKSPARSAKPVQKKRPAAKTVAPKPAKPKAKPVEKAPKPAPKDVKPKPPEKGQPLALRPIAVATVVRKPLSPAHKPISIPPARVKVVSKVKPLPMEFMMELAKSVKDAVVPGFNTVRGRETVGNATSGDVTFQIDKVAERALLQFLKDSKLPVAYYSEDSGYTTFASGQPQYLLIVDPIDGTRAAKNGFEWCCVSVASTRVIERPCMGDVDTACVLEIANDRAFYAERGKGAKIITAGVHKKPKLNRNHDLESISWAMTVPARPAELIFPTAAKLIDLSSLKGGFFACNSTSYSLTRLLTNQLDACVDFANLFLRDIPSAVQDHFINAGRGATLGIAPYDIAAALLIAEESGAIVTDALGKSFKDVLLLDSSATNHRSLIAAANKELYGKLWSFFDLRIKQFEQLLTRKITN